MRRLVVGVIGHVDHGKTALVRALTGKNTDRLAEEQQRGMSIVLGFAHLNVSPDAAIDLIDVPGHERFVRAMIAGATGMDAVLLVVAANEGVKPQTAEHVNIASLLGLSRAIVVISKVDLVAPEQALQVARDVTGLLERSGLDPLPPVMTSVLREEGIEAVRSALETLAADAQPCRLDGIPFLPIDRAFTVPGHGPVVTGTLRGGRVAVAESLQLMPSQRTVRVREVEVHGSPVDAAVPGQRVAVNLRNIDIAALKRGMILTTPEALTLSRWLTIAIRAVDGALPLKNGMRLRALLGTNEVDARLRLLDCDELPSGQSGLAQLHCAADVAIPAGEHVILRIPSPPQTVAGGRILEPVTARHKRNCPQILEHLEALRTLPTNEMIATEVQRTGLAGSTLRRLSHLGAMTIPQIARLLDTLPVVVTRAGVVVWKADLQALLSRILSLLEPSVRGLSVDQLATALPGVDPAVLDEAVARLADGGAVIKRGGVLRTPRPQADRARARQEMALASRIAQLLRRKGLRPPTPKDILADSRIKPVVGRLLREGVIVSAVDRAKGREILFHRDAIEEAKRRLSPALKRGDGLLVSEVGELLGISRKYSVPLLNYFDEIQFTRRINERRVLYARAVPAK